MTVQNSKITVAGTTPDIKSPDETLIELINTLESIDEYQEDAMINQSSMPNKNGGRILF